MCDIVAASSNWWIGHLIDQLAYLGIEEQTAIIFVSDPGFLLGEHG
jgi:arylsulfatase A-like enzyme